MTYVEVTTAHGRVAGCEAKANGRPAAQCEQCFNHLGSCDIRTVSIIIPALLPHEPEWLVISSARHCASLDAARCRLEVVVVYNGVSASKRLEEELAQIDNVVVHHAAGSQSKAENLNFAIERCTGDVIGILDVDTRPWPHTLRDVIQEFARHPNVDMVRGSTFVTPAQQGIVAQIIRAEDIFKHRCLYPRLAPLGLVRFSSGSNVYWRSHVLHTLQFSKLAFTEDVEHSVRATSQGAVTSYRPEMGAWELAPVSLRDVYRQRERWAAGWLEILSDVSRRETQRARSRLARLLALSFVVSLSSTLLLTYGIGRAALIAAGATNSIGSDRVVGGILAACCGATGFRFLGHGPAPITKRFFDWIVFNFTRPVMLLLALCTAATVRWRRPPTWFVTPRPRSEFDY